MVLYPNGTTKEPTVTGVYGDPRPGNRIHAGVDYVGFPTIRAIARGKVTHAGWLNVGAGNAVVYDLDERGPNGEIISVCHFHGDGGLSVKRGDIVMPGQGLIDMGSTGGSTGDHDHLEIRYWLHGNYRTVDPRKWIADRLPRDAPASGNSSDRPSTPNKKEEDEMIVNIVGKAGKRNGGAYYIAGNVATYLGAAVKGALTLSDAQADALSRRVSGI